MKFLPRLFWPLTPGAAWRDRLLMAAYTALLLSGCLAFYVISSID